MKGVSAGIAAALGAVLLLAVRGVACLPAPLDGVEAAAAAGACVRDGLVVSETAAVRVGGRTILANVVRVSLQDPRVSVRVGLGRDQVGGTEDLLKLANRKGAVAAINGTFFEAYADGDIKDPLGTIITGGEMVHKGDIGTVFGLASSKEVRMEPVRFKIAGTTDSPHGGPFHWYAYWINHAPGRMTADHAAVYTPARGRTTGPLRGVSIVVEEACVTRVVESRQETSVEIPAAGFVLNFQGCELPLANLFCVGSLVDYTVAFADGSPISSFWAEVEEALGGGPKLVANGEVVYSVESARAEGFTEAGILSAKSARSALGLSSAGELLLVTLEEARTAELAAAMRSLGAREAMNLDGGASSGLVSCGRYITRPERMISNALLVFAPGS